MSRRSRRQGEAAFSLFSFQDIIAAVTGVVVLLTLLLLLELMLRPEVSIEAPAEAAAATPEVTLEELAAAGDRLEALRERLRRAAPVATRREVEAARRGVAAMADLESALVEREDGAVPRVERAGRHVLRRRDELAALTRELERVREATELERATSRVVLLEGDRGGKRTWFVEVEPEAVRVGTIDEGGLARLERAMAGPESAAAALRWAASRPRGEERFVLLVHPAAGATRVFNRLEAGLRSQGFEVGWDVWVEPEPLLRPAPEEASDAPQG